MVKASELRQKSQEELSELSEGMRKELFEVRSEFRMARSVERPHRMKTLRKDLARIKTILTEREGK